MRVYIHTTLAKLVGQPARRSPSFGSSAVTTTNQLIYPLPLIPLSTMADITAHTWWDESVSHVYLTKAQCDEAGLSKGYRAFEMPGLTEGIDPLIALYKAIGQPTAAVRTPLHPPS